MSQRAGLQLLLHGALVLTIGLLAGIPMGEAIGAGDAEAVRAWRVAHTGGVTGGLMLMVIGLAAPHVQLGRWSGAFVWILVISTYAITAGFLTAAVSGQRGIGPSEATGAGAFVNAVYLIGTVGVLVGAILLLLGIGRALRGAGS